MTSIPAIKAYLVDTLLPSLFSADVAVFYGLPVGYQPADIVAVLDGRAEATQPVFGTTRPIEERGSVDILISSFRGGGPEAQRLATEAAFALHDTLRDYFKTAPHENLGGAVRTAGISAVELLEDDDAEAVKDGRLAQLNLTLSFQARN